MDIKMFKQFNVELDKLNYENAHLNNEIDEDFKSIS
jgi:hypothetical protein